MIGYRTASQCRDFRSRIERVKRGYLVTTIHAKQFCTHCNFFDIHKGNILKKGITTV